MAEQPSRRVQDDSREVALARMLNLVVSERRIGPDAYDRSGNPYELKTTTQSSLGTGRDVGPPYLLEMQTRYLIAARGHQTRYGFAFEEIYFLHPADLSEWITPIENRLQADASLVDAAANALANGGRSQADVDRLKYLGTRGLTLNNPKLPWRYVQQHGTMLGEHPELDLEALVVERPLAASSDA